MWAKVKAGLSAYKNKNQKETGKSASKGKVFKTVDKLFLAYVALLTILIVGAYYLNVLPSWDELGKVAVMSLLGYDIETIENIKDSYDTINRESSIDKFPIANFAPDTKPDREFWDSIRPTVSFKEDKLDVIGFGGGSGVGRWFYSAEKEGKTTPDKKPGCLVFTYGSKGSENNSFPFEKDILVNTICNVVVFSPLDEPIRNFSLIEPWNKRVILVNLTKNKGGDYLANFMELQGLDWIDIAEVEMDMNTIANVEANIGLVPRFGQLIFKFHRFEGREEKITGRVLNIFDQVQSKGFRLFHTNSSCNGSDDCISEYSFVNANAWSRLLTVPTKKFTVILK